MPPTPGARPPACSTGTGTPIRDDSQPASSWVAGSSARPVTAAAVGAARIGVERRGQLRPPRRGPGPGQVGVAGPVVLGPLPQRRDRVRARGDVGDPPVGEDAERVVRDEAPAAARATR